MKTHTLRAKNTGVDGAVTLPLNRSMSVGACHAKQLGYYVLNSGKPWENLSRGTIDRFVTQKVHFGSDGKNRVKQGKSSNDCSRRPSRQILLVPAMC